MAVGVGSRAECGVHQQGGGETARVEFKARFDPTDKRAELELIREIVAFANSGGGQIIIGRGDDGAFVGVDEALETALDPARLCGKIAKFVAPESLEVTVAPIRSDEGTVIALEVASWRLPPLVMARDGTCGQGQKQETIFRKGDVCVRRGTKAEVATRMDFIRWTDERVAEARKELLDNLHFLVSLPPGATVATFAGDEEIDEPNALLKRAGRAWERNPEKLLTSNELASLLLTSSALDLSDPAVKVLVHSALRKRSTLWHWVARVNPGPAWIRETVEEAMAGSDRDKSDAGRAIVDLAAVFLDGDGFDGVVVALASSTYKHFRDAAEGCNQADVLDRLRRQRASATYGTPLSDWTLDDLAGETRRLAQVLMSEGGTRVKRVASPRSVSNCSHAQRQGWCSSTRR